MKTKTIMLLVFVFAQILKSHDRAIAVAELLAISV